MLKPAGGFEVFQQVLLRKNFLWRVYRVWCEVLVEMKAMGAAVAPVVPHTSLTFWGINFLPVFFGGKNSKILRKALFSLC